MRKRASAAGWGPQASGGAVTSGRRWARLGRQLLFSLLHPRYLAHVSPAHSLLSTTRPPRLVGPVRFTVAAVRIDEARERWGSLADAPRRPSSPLPPPTQPAIMSNTLEQLKKYTTVVSDSGDFECASTGSRSLSLALSRPRSSSLGPALSKQQPS